MGNLSYASRASMSRFRLVRVSVSHCVMKSVCSLGGWGVSLERPVLKSVSSFGEWGIFSYKSIAGNDLVVRQGAVGG